MTATSSQPRLSPAALLWASAFVLTGLLLVQLGRSKAPVGGPSPEASLAAAMQAFDGAGAGGGSVSRVGDYTIMAFDAGNDDALAVLDGRGEQMFFYRIKNLNEFEFLGRENLPTLFNTARRLGPGRK
ncbi:MAG TPA: hypothetical protein PKE29_17395 [Phycisphaerales bacterium]|nr:hypothetical protein [Phycisphaerales bacterium]